MARDTKLWNEGQSIIDRIDQLYKNIRDGEDVEESMIQLERVAAFATRHFWHSAMKHPQLATAIARDTDSLPVNVSPLNPAWDDRPKGKKRQIPYDVELALKFPIGEGLPVKVKGSGQKKVQHDTLYWMLLDTIRYDFSNLRFIGEAKDDIEQRILALPELTKENLKQWLDVIVDYLVERKNMGKSLHDEESCLYSVCIDRATTLLDRKKRQQLEKLGGTQQAHKLRQNLGKGIKKDDAGLKESNLLTEIDQMKVEFPILRRALRENIDTRLKSILKG